MTAMATTHAPPLALQVGHLARRSVRRTMRSPAAVMPSLIMPMLLFAINGSGLAAATRIPGFPSDSFLDFAIVLSMLQACLFAAINAGQAIATDIEGGFINRLALTPMHGWSLVLGHTAGAVVNGMFSITIFTLVGLASGIRLEAGPLGLLALVALSALHCLAFSLLGAAIALRAGTGEAIQGTFPLFFAALFLSSVNMPRDLISVDWFRVVATVNPVSYMAEGIRSLIITGWDWAAIGRDLAVSVGAISIGLAMSGKALGRRLART